MDFRFVPVVEAIAQRAKVVFNFDAIGFILGLGYVMGLRSSMVLCAGGVLSNFVLVPMIWFVGRHLPDAVYPATASIAGMTAAQIFRGYVRFVGVGAIATAGHLRHREVAQDRRGLVRHRAQGVPGRRGRGGRADRPGHVR